MRKIQELEQLLTQLKTEKPNPDNSLKSEQDGYLREFYFLKRKMVKLLEALKEGGEG